MTSLVLEEFIKRVKNSFKAKVEKEEKEMFPTLEHNSFLSLWPGSVAVIQFFLTV